MGPCSAVTQPFLLTWFAGRWMTKRSAGDAGSSWRLVREEVMEWRRKGRAGGQGEGTGEDRCVFGWGRTEDGDSALRLVYRRHSCALSLPREFPVLPLLRGNRPPPNVSSSGEWLLCVYMYMIVLYIL